MKLCLSLGLLLFAASVQASSSDVEAKAQQLKNNKFHLQMEFVVDASIEQTHQILTDYANISQLNPSIISSKEIQSPDQHINRVETITKDCFFLFCKKIRRVEDVSSPSLQRINSVIVPELSDFSAGVAAWTLTTEQDRTRVLYEAVLQPKFSTPSIGLTTIQKRMRTRLIQSAMIINDILREAPLS